MEYKILLVNYGLMLCLLTVVLSQDRVVKTSLGDLRGKLETYQEGSVLQFLGVRYAKSPTHDLRFRKPVAVEGWRGEVDATQYGPSCPQVFPYSSLVELPNFNINEDCLVLNVYKPLNNNGERVKAVMVYLHGGGFNSGQGMATDGSLLALKGDVIVVTINYRIDILGFLYTGMSSSTNFGLWDQVLALNWIQQHIGAFGGDAARVTVFGVSAGAFSVGMHLFSPHSKGLFQRAILQSGSPFTKLAFAYDPLEITRNISVQLACIDSNDNTLDPDKVLTCLREKHYNDLIQASVLARSHDRIAYRLDVAPVVDGDFLTDYPVNIIKSGNRDLPFYQTDIIVGTNTAEGGNVLYMLNNFNKELNIDTRLAVPSNVLCDNVTKYLIEDFYNNDVNIKDRVCSVYETDAPGDEQSMKVVDLVGDMMFVAPAVQTLNNHAQYATNAATYQYLFSYEPIQSNLKPYFPWFKGSNHLDDVPFVFGPKVMYRKSIVVSPDEERLSNQIISYWSNFAKSGNVNDNRESLPHWPLYKLRDKIYLNISLPTTTGQELWPLRMELWNYYLPSYNNKTVQTDDTDGSGVNGVPVNNFNMLLLCVITFIKYVWSTVNIQ